MLSFAQQPACDQLPLSVAPYDRWLTLDGEPSLLFHRIGGAYVLRFIDIADFSVNLSTRHVTCQPVPGIADETLADLHFNQVLPLIMGTDGDLVLHASAVATPAGAVAFLGATGRGKSTLAAAFARQGSPFITDDGLILDASERGYLVRPRRPILRLRPDSEMEILGAAKTPDKDEATKTRVAARPGIPFAEAAVPLAAIYLLTEPGAYEAPEIRRLPPPEALTALMSHCFILDVEDKPVVRAHFHQLSDLAVQMGCFTLDYPRRYGDLPSVIDAVIAHANSGGPNT